MVDEGHNLRHGFGKDVSSRNRVLGLALGHPEDGAVLFPGAGPRADRVLVLSATPVETSFNQLWAQMDLLGKGDEAPGLRAPALDADQGKQIASDFVVRRLTEIEIAGEPHTKNMYRREWRGGGVDRHDAAGHPDARQRLIVALIQKKVAEVLARKGSGARRGRFGRSFQIGMLSSFEVSPETVGVAAGDEGNFTDTEAVENRTEREGIDTRSMTG